MEHLKSNLMPAAHEFLANSTEIEDLNSQIPETRYQAAKALIKIKSESLKIVSALKKNLLEHTTINIVTVQNSAELLIEILKEIDETQELKELLIITLGRYLATSDTTIQNKALQLLAKLHHLYPKDVITLIDYYNSPGVYIHYLPTETKEFCRKVLIQLGYNLDNLHIAKEALTKNNLFDAIIQHKIKIVEKYLSSLPWPENIKINCRKIASHQLLETNSLSDAILYNKTLLHLAPKNYILYQNLGRFEHAAAMESQNNEEKQNLLQAAENNFKKSIELNSSVNTLVEYALFLVAHQRYEEAIGYLIIQTNSNETLNYSYEMKNILTDMLKIIIEETIEIKISSILLAHYLLIECYYDSAQTKPENLRTTDYARIKLNFNKLKKQLEITPCDFAEHLISLIQEKFAIALPKTETKPSPSATYSTSESKSPYISHAEQVIVIQGDVNVSGTNQIHGFFANKFEQSSSITSSNSSAQDEDNTNATFKQKLRTYSSLF